MTAVHRQASRHYVRYGLVSGIIIFLDQLTKTVIQERMMLHESIPVIPNFFNLTYIRNPGAAFGLFVQANTTVRMTFFVSITLVAIAVIGYLFLKTYQEDAHRDIPHPSWQNWGVRGGLTLVLGGAIGNLIDRLRYGEVIDFLDFYIGRYHWPAFNVADSSITVGVSLLFLATFLGPRESPRSTQQKTREAPNTPSSPSGPPTSPAQPSEPSQPLRSKE